MYQKCVFVGRLGQDPKITTFDNGGKVAQFSIACTEHAYKKKDGTEVPERTDWIPCVLWRGLADVAEKFLKKGSLVLVEGKLRVRAYDDKNGVRRTAYEVYADEMKMLGSGSSNGSMPPPPEIGGMAPQQAVPQQMDAQQRVFKQTAPADAAAAMAAMAASREDDDLPF